MRRVWDLALLVLATFVAAGSGKAILDAASATFLLSVAVLALDSHPGAAAVGPLVAALPCIALERKALRRRLGRAGRFAPQAAALPPPGRACF